MKYEENAISTLTKEEAQKITPQMDRAIEKGVKVIKLHSIFIKGKESVILYQLCENTKLFWQLKK